MIRIAFYLLLSLGLSVMSLAAPHPGAASSALSNPLSSYWLVNQSFELTMPTSTEWQWGFLERSDLIRIQARSTKSEQAAIISLHFDKGTKTLPKSQEYTNLGFQVINSGELQNKHHGAFFFDLYHSEKKHQVRQYLLKTDKGLFSYSCSGDSDSLQKFSKTCADIFQSLKVK